MKMSGGATVTIFDAVLSAGVGTITYDHALTMYVKTSSKYGWQITPTRIDCPRSNIPTSQTTIPFETKQLPLVVLRESKVAFGGSVLVTTTPDAGAGPRF